MSIPLNPECTEKNRCGACRKDLLSEIGKRARAAKEASAALPPGQRICVECGHPKPSSEFIAPGKRGARACCEECGTKRQERRKIAAREARKAAAHKRPKSPPRKRPHRDRKRYVCIRACGNKTTEKNARCKACYDKERIHATASKLASTQSALRSVQLFMCGGGCGQQCVTAPGMWCVQCKKNNLTTTALRTDRNQVYKRITAAMAKGTLAGAIWVGEEMYSLSATCPRCSKPTMIRALCYTCSTGKGITLQVLPRPVVPAPSKPLPPLRKYPPKE